LSGNQWSVLDRDLAIRSKFNLVSQRLKLGLTRSLENSGIIEASWLYLF